MSVRSHFKWYTRWLGVMLMVEKRVGRITIEMVRTPLLSTKMFPYIEWVLLVNRNSQHRNHDHYADKGVCGRMCDSNRSAFVV